MKTQCITLFLCISAFTSFSQNTIRYHYDGAGNRIMRMIIFSDSQLKSDNQFEDYMAKFTDESSYTDSEEYFEDTVNEQDIKLFPNPTRGNLTVQIPQIKDNSLMYLQLFDNTGRLLEQYTDISEYTHIDMYSYPHGVYILKIIGLHNDSRTWKIIKQD